MGYDRYRTEYVTSYYKGINNLSEQARNNFINSLQSKNISPEQDDFLLNEQFKTWILCNELPKNSNQELSSLYTDPNKRKETFKTTAQRDKTFAQLAMSSDLDGVSDLVDNPTQSKWDAFLEVLNASFANAAFNDGWSYDSAGQDIIDDLDDAHDNFSSVLTKAASNSIRKQAREYTNQQLVKNKYNTVIAYNSMPEYSKSEYRNQILELSKLLSPDNFGYRLNGQASKEQLDALAVEYMLREEYGGAQMANEYLQNYWQDYVASRQTTEEKWLNTGAQIANEIVSTVALVGGVIGGVLGFNGNGDDWSEGILDNPATRWAQGLSETGAYTSSTQKYLKSIGVNEDAILNTVQQEKEMFTSNTIFELLGQYGFTVGSMALSGGLSALAKGGTSLAMKGAKTVGALSKIRKAGRISQMTIPFVVGAGEAGLEALSARDEALRIGQQQINNFIDDKINQDILSFVNANPDKVNMEILAQYPELENYHGSYGTISAERNTRNYSPEDIKNMALLLQNNPEFRAEYEKKYNDLKEESLSLLDDTQESRMWTTFLLNLAITGSLNSTLQLTQMAPGIRKALPRKRNMHTRLVDFATEGPSQWKALAKNFNVKTLLKDKIKEAAGEGLQEWGQALVSEYDVGKAENIVSQYLARRYAAGKPLDVFEEDTRQMVMAGLMRAGKHATSDQAFKEALYGSLSTLLGGVTVNLNASFGKRRNNESSMDMILRNSPITLGGVSELLLSGSKIKAMNKAAQDQANAINAFFADKKNTDLVFNIIEGLGAAKAYQSALESGDERQARNSELDMLFNAYSMVNALYGTEFYNTAMETLKERKGLKEANITVENSKEANAIAEYRARNSDNSSSDAEILNQISTSASTLLDVMKQAKKETESIRSIFGEDISLDVQNALVSNRLHYKDTEKRIKLLKNELSAIDYFEENASNSPYSKSIQQGYARYGNLSQVKKSSEVLQEEIKKLEADLKTYQDVKGDASISEVDRGVAGLISAQLSRILDEKKLKKSKLDDYIKELKALEEGQANNIVLSMQDIANLDAESRHALLSNTREHVYVDEVQSNGKTKRKKVLNPSKRQLSNRQWREIEKFKKKGQNEYKDFDSKLEDLYLLEKDLKSYSTAEEFYIKNPNALLSLSEDFKQKANRKLAEKKYQYLLDEKEISDYNTFKEKVLEALDSAENDESKKIIMSTIRNSQYADNFKQEYKTHLDLLKEIKKTSVYKKLSEERQEELIALFDTAFYQNHIIDVNKTSNDKVNDIISTITKDAVENTLNRKNKVENSSITDFTDLGFSAVQAFDQARKESKKVEERNKPVEVAETTPVKNTPNKSEGPAFEGPVVEISRSNPTVTLSEEDLIKRGATPAMIQFYKDNKILENITRLIAEGKLHSKSTVFKQATQVYFTVDRIGHYYEVIQLVEDNDGQYVVEGKKYSIIGIETDANAFTSEEKKEANVKKLLSRTASVSKVGSQRVLGKGTNLKDIAPGNEDSVIKNLTVSQRETSSGTKKEIVYKSRTGRGGTVYTSSVSDTPIDKVLIHEGKTAIDLLFEYQKLPIEERVQKAAELLKNLDYSHNKYYYDQLLEVISSILKDDNLNNKKVAELNTSINNIFKQLYFLGQSSDGALTQFAFSIKDDTLSLKIHNEQIDSEITQERSLPVTSVTKESLLEILMSTLAEASVDEQGNPKKYSAKNYQLSFEIGLKDLELINNPFALRGLSGKEATAMSKRIGAKKGFLKDKIALGALQLTGNSDKLNPTNITLVFNYDGKTTSDSQIVPESNSDTTESRSNTVETTTGEVVDGDTGVTITPASNEVKMTDEIEEKAAKVPIHQQLKGRFDLGLSFPIVYKNANDNSDGSVLIVDKLSSKLYSRKLAYLWLNSSSFEEFIASVNMAGMKFKPYDVKALKQLFDAKTVTSLNNAIEMFTPDRFKDIASTSNTVEEKSTKEEETQPIDSTIDINNPLGIQASESSIVTEEEDEIKASDIQNSMTNDDEFGSLYKTIKNNQINKTTEQETLKQIDKNNYISSSTPSWVSDIIDDIFNNIDNYNYLNFISGQINEKKAESNNSNDYDIIIKLLEDIFSLQGITIQSSKVNIVKEKTLSTDEYKDLYNSYNTNPYQKQLFDIVYNIAKQLDIKYIIGNIKAAPQGKAGRYSIKGGKYGTVRIDKTTLNSLFLSDNNKANIILHELIHAVTAQAIDLVNNNIKIPGVTPSKNLIKAVKSLQKIYDELKNKKGIKDYYAMTSIHEMLAELSNPAFLHQLFESQSWWKKIIDKISRILANMLESITHKKYPIMTVTSKRLRKNLNIIMQESLKIGSLMGAKVSTSNNTQHLQQYKRQKVNSLQHSNNALTESWDWMSDKMQESLTKRGLSKEVWEQLTPEEKEKAIECR